MKKKIDKFINGCGDKVAKKIRKAVEKPEDYDGVLGNMKDIREMYILSGDVAEPKDEDDEEFVFDEDEVMESDDPYQELIDNLAKMSDEEIAKRQKEIQQRLDEISGKNKPYEPPRYAGVPTHRPEEEKKWDEEFNRRMQEIEEREKTAKRRVKVRTQGLPAPPDFIRVDKKKKKK